MIRAKREITDIWAVVVKLFQAKADGDSDWLPAIKVIQGYPNEEKTADLDHVIIYIEKPKLMGTEEFQGSLPRKTYNCLVGCWVTRKAGWNGALAHVESCIVEFLANSQAFHSQLFDVTLGTTAYTDQSLDDFQLGLAGFDGPNDILMESEDVYRGEFNVQIDF